MQIKGCFNLEYSKELEKYCSELLNLSTGKMTENEFKDYVFGSLFLMYLSDNLESFLNKELENDELTFKEAWEDEDFRDDLIDESLESLGYFISPELLFSSIISKVRNNEDILEDIQDALEEFNNSIQGFESAEDFENIFENYNLSSLKLGDKSEEKNQKLSELFFKLSNFKKLFPNYDISHLFDYLLQYFAIHSHEKVYDIYTPSYLVKLIAKLVTSDNKILNSVYDPTCGSASLLLGVREEASKINDFYGQEVNQSYYNLARMNMTIHGIPFDDFNIEQGDTLENPKHENMKFDAIVSHVPSVKWSANEKFLHEDRFSAWGKIPPKSKADFAFIQHMIYHLKESGTMVTLIHNGVLFRKYEKDFRKYIIEVKNLLDAVILLPQNLYFDQSAQSLILVFKKSRLDDDKILFINATEFFESKGSAYELNEENINKIFDLYINREDIDGYSYNASIDEIRKNDYILSVSRYIDYYDYFVPDTDLEGICEDLKSLSREIDAIDEDIKRYCERFGIDAPIF